MLQFSFISIIKHMKSRGIFQRAYAFEQFDIRSGDQYVLKITYPFKVFFINHF